MTSLSTPLKHVLIALYLLLNNAAIAQYSITFKPVFDGHKLTLDSNYTTKGDTISISKLKFYVSAMAVYSDSGCIYTSINQAVLINAAEETTFLLGTLPSSGFYNKLTFYLGIDSTTNSSGALDGPLDPSQGMYWTWQSGYINLKLEGSSSKNPARKNEFQFHLGGYMYPNNALQKVSIDIPSQQDITILLDLAPFFNQTDLSTNSHIMSPGTNAVQLSALIASLFSVSL